MSRNWYLCVAASTALHGGIAAMFLIGSATPTAAPKVESSVQVRLVATPRPSARPGDRKTAAATAAKALAVADRDPQADGDAAAAPVGEAAAPAAGAPAVAAATPDPGAMSDYYRLLQAHLARYHTYPAALTARPAGMVRLGLIVQRDGRVMDAWVESSSGVGALDDAALRTLKRAEPLPVLPKALPGAIDLIVPLRYEAGLKAAS